MPAEKRRSSRLNLVRELQAHFDTMESVVSTHTIDVSRHGLFLAGHTRFPVGTKVRLLLSVESPLIRMSVDGVIVRVQTGVREGLGIEFLHQPPEWEQFYELLLAERAGLNG